ncbi:MAG: hypothetical protein CMK09_04255 [Ponticaulis sp.]|nr:hypothetical protein [Ponticaulis sp.]|tara:strand:+ start:1804 stop:2610 length:807 start_codon:yes stop_codon:yes gene_type:complete
MTIPDEEMGEYKLRFVKDANGDGFSGRAFSKADKGEILRADSLEELRAKLANYVGRVHPNYFGWDGAMKRFSTLFPDGFQSDYYCKKERNYKLVARDHLAEHFPPELAMSGNRDTEAALEGYRKTNMLSKFEQMRVQELLRGSNAQAFIAGAADIVLGDLDTGFSRMIAAAKPHDAAKWPVLTYLPFFWSPKTQMFLKPTVTKDFAERVGHRFQYDYEPTPNVVTYRSLLNLASQTAQKTSDLGPRDNIDVQSFIWAVGAYTDADLPD